MKPSASKRKATKERKLELRKHRIRELASRALDQAVGGKKDEQRTYTCVATA